MVRKMIFTFFLIFFCCTVNARVFYVNGKTNNPRGRYNYPVYPIQEIAPDQASRDLDLKFSADDLSDNSEDRDVFYPVQKVYAYATPERPIVELNQEYDRPVAYYKLPEVPSRRIIYGDQFPVSENNRKAVNLNDNGSHKGEVVLELRVIANNNNGI